MGCLISPLQQFMLTTSVSAPGAKSARQETTLRFAGGFNHYTQEPGRDEPLSRPYSQTDSHLADRTFWLGKTVGVMDASTLEWFYPLWWTPITQIRLNEGVGELRLDVLLPVSQPPPQNARQVRYNN